ncbi:MAG TPA: TIGR03620 family F420-dependent LLM class oxidoreductase [Acidimicrobiia bacterium]|nr:TIGR03620 family F420-dependent LLM class oxidoreductase [Acidimicrobiia bacterium]
MRLDAPLPDLGRVGVWSWSLVDQPAAQVRRAAAAVEDMGYRTVWFPESRGREAFVTAALILSATNRLAAVTGIASIWARDPNAAASGAMALGEAWPGRFVLGLGVSHAPSVARRGSTYEHPIARMKDYLDGITAASFVGPPADPEVPVVLAALGPQMLRLAASRTSGAHPYFVPVEHTRTAREVMGPGPWLAPEQAVVIATDPVRARAIARRHTRGYLALDNYRRNLVRLGWSESDLDGEGSDALVDAVVAWGDADAVASRIRAHLEAGADHVGIQVLSDDPFPLADLSALAERLL